MFFVKRETIIILQKLTYILHANIQEVRTAKAIQSNPEITYEQSLQLIIT